MLYEEIAPKNNHYYFSRELIAVESTQRLSMINVFEQTNAEFVIIYIPTSIIYQFTKQVTFA